MSAARQTAQLKRVMAVLEASGEALSAEQIWQAAGQNLNRVTVYRILKRLSASGVLETLPHGRSRRYRLCHDHPHFYCRACGRCECLPQAALNLELIKSQVKGEVEHVAIRIEGLCSTCRG